MRFFSPEYPFLNFLGERCKAEHDLQGAQRTRSNCKSWPEKKSRQRKLKKKSLENVNSHIASIKEEINMLEARYPKEWNENVTELTKHFFQKK